MGYSIVDFAKSLRIDRCKIRNTPNLIFLCGGKTAEKGKYYRSARDYFYRHLKSKAAKIAQNVKLAETVNAWFRRDVFPDLLELENYLADLADITILFVESAGSIAELGAFAALEAVRSKALAVLNSHYDRERTFISDGPVQKLKDENKELVHYYRWNPAKLNSPATIREFKDMSEHLTDFLVRRQKSHTKEQTFNKRKHGHVLLMAADLIRIAGVATKTDIADCFKELGCEFNHEQLERYLSLLESMSFIRRELRGTQAFYVADEAKPFIRYAYLPDAPFTDQQRIKSAIRVALEPMRKKILANSMVKKGTANG